MRNNTCKKKPIKNVLLFKECTDTSPWKASAWPQQVCVSVFLWFKLVHKAKRMSDLSLSFGVSKYIVLISNWWMPRSTNSISLPTKMCEMEVWRPPSSISVQVHLKRNVMSHKGEASSQNYDFTRFSSLVFVLKCEARAFSLNRFAFIDILLWRT